MKKNIMLRMVVFFSLILLTPCWLCAEMRAKEEAAWVEELRATVQKSPEEFMKRLKSLWDNPQSSSVEYAEKMSGMKLARWEILKKADVIRKVNRRMVNRYSIELKHEVYPDFPYNFYVVTPVVGEIADKTSFGAGFRGVKEIGEPNRWVCVTPKLTKEMFGEPTEIKEGHIRGGETPDGDYIYYKYVNEKKNMTFRYDHYAGNLKNRENFCASNVDIIINQ